MNDRPGVWIACYSFFTIIVSILWKKSELALYGFSQESLFDMMICYAFCGLVAHNIARKKVK